MAFLRLSNSLSLQTHNCYKTDVKRGASLLLILLGMGGLLGGDDKPYERLEGCRFVSGAYHDGDSFHVKHQGKEYIFRLYFVDCPEDKSESRLKDRIAEQMEHWKLTSQKDLFKAADEATRFTKFKLKEPFTIYTRWTDAKGASRMKRYYAHIEVKGRSLAEMLTEAGWARVHGRPVKSPKGRDGFKVRRDLEKLEKKARSSRRGVWSFSSR